MKKRPIFIGYSCLAKKKLTVTMDVSTLPYKHSFNDITMHCSQPFDKTNETEHYFVGIMGTIYSFYDCPAINNDLIALYKEYDQAYTSKLNGDFVIFLFDKKKQTLFISNDRYYPTHFYYYLNGIILFFGSSLNILRQYLANDLKWDQASLPSFLQTGFSSTEQMPYKNVFRLLPTFTLVLQNQSYYVTENWKGEYLFQRKALKDVNQSIDQYEFLFQTSIINFLKHSQPKELGCFLSGGHDTSYTFIQANKIFKKPIHTFTAVFKDFGFNEAPKAQYLVERFGGIQHTVTIGAQALDYIPQMIRCAEEPVAGGSLPIYMCIKAASKYVDAMLSGDAGDTLWGEYYPVNEWHSYLKNFPYWMRRLILLLNQAALHVWDWERLWESEHLFSIFAHKDMYHHFLKRLCTYRHYQEKALKTLLAPDLFQKIKYNRSQVSIPFNKNNFHDILVEAKMFLGVYQYMILPTYKSLAAFNLDFHTPYFHKDLIDFINALPQAWLNDGTSFQKLINKAEKRKLHKRALLRYLPREYVDTAQQSLDVPFHSFLPSRPAILNNLLKRLKKRGWYNNQTLERIFNEFPRQHIKPHEIIELKHHGYRIFCLLTYEVWCMQFLDNDMRDQDSDRLIPLDQYLEL